MMLRKKGSRLGLAFLAALIAGAPTDLAAQRGGRGQGPPGQGQGRRAELQRQIQQRFTRALEEQLGLEEEETAEVGQVLQSFQERRRELARERQNVRVRLRVLGREELGGAELTDESARAALDNLLRVAEEEARLFAEEQAALLEILSPVQVLKLQQLREQMAERLRGLRGGQGRPGGPGGPFPDR